MVSLGEDSGFGERAAQVGEQFYVTRGTGGESRRKCSSQQSKPARAQQPASPNQPARQSRASRAEQSRINTRTSPRPALTRDGHHATLRKGKAKSVKGKQYQYKYQ